MVTTRTMGGLVGAILAVCAGAHVFAAEEPAADEATRAVVRALEFAVAGGDWWIEKKGCPSCHHVPFLLWTHNEAARAGVAVDAKRLGAWENWTLAGMLAGNGAGLDTMYQVLLGRDRNSAWRRKPPLNGRSADPYETLWQFVLQQQKPDGSWAPGGQLKSPAEVTTGWTILALASREAGNRAGDLDSTKGLNPSLAETMRQVDMALPESRRKAVGWLASRPPAPGSEARLLRMLVARSQDDPRWKELLSDLQIRQNSDGGWASLDTGKTSDAFATGQVMWALRQSGVAPADPAMMRARQWLVRTQQPDGSWTTETRSVHPITPQRAVVTDPIFRYWGSAWATIGLLQTLPGASRAASN